MKKIFTILLAGVSTLAIAQKRSHLSRSIDDDGSKLTIKVSGTIDGREVDIHKSFDVEGMSKEDREALRDEVLAAIADGNLALPAPPASPAKPVASRPPVAPAAPEPMTFSSNEVNAAIVSSGKGYIKEPVSGDPKGFSRQVRFNSETGELFLKYKYTKNGDEYIFEKTVNAAEKSEKERQKVIDTFEREIGLPGKGMEM